jgi:hypothetical protein
VKVKAGDKRFRSYPPEKELQKLQEQIRSYLFAYSVKACIPAAKHWGHNDKAESNLAHMVFLSHCQFIT